VAGFGLSLQFCIGDAVLAGKVEVAQRSFHRTLRQLTKLGTMLAAWMEALQNPRSISRLLGLRISEGLNSKAWEGYPSRQGEGRTRPVLCSGVSSRPPAGRALGKSKANSGNPSSPFTCGATLKFLIDECLHTSLVQVAHAAGYVADHVNYLSLGGLKDWQLLPVIRERGFTIVTNNGADFLAPFGKEPLHPGIIIIVPNVTPVLQRELLSCHRGNLNWPGVLLIE